MARRGNIYFACGLLGYLVAMALSMYLAADLTTRLVIALVPGTIFLALARLSTVLFGYERIVFYEHALAITTLTALTGWLAGSSFLAVLDITALGVGTFLAFGRIGCHGAACCHGRPTRSRLAVRYGAHHVRAGLEARLLDTPLIPTQLLDAIATAGAVILGLAALDAGPGRATAMFTVVYGIARFHLELLRGDERPHAFGLSQAQWTALVTSWLVTPLLPSVAGPIALALTALAIVLVVCHRARWPYRYWLAHPNHARELETLVRARSRHARGTTVGLRISVHALDAVTLDLVASHPQRSLEPAMLAGAAHQLGARWQLVAAVAGQAHNVVHLVVRDGRAS